MIPSLLPYLQHDQGKFALEIFLGEPDPRKPLHGQRPFLVYSSDDPLSQLIAGAIVSDGGKIVKPLLARVQKDSYSKLNTSLTPLTNRHIDLAWQQAYSLHTNNPDTALQIPLAQQMDTAGRLQKFSPLFFCRLRTHYFHPPCPSCGAPLVQCDDDQLLQQLHLAPYTNSLIRYLYCQPCRTRGTTACFYTYECHPHDPEWVHDRKHLIYEFGLLPPEADHATKIPCPTCPNHPLCFGKNGQVENYISFLSFYPFYMMLFEAGTLMAADFIPLVSGAEIPELMERLKSDSPSGRIAMLKALTPAESPAGLFFAPQDPRRFLETLHLKLNFLSQLARDVCSRIDSYHYPNLGLAFDTIWVQIAEHDTLFPYLWNFKIQRNDIGCHLADSAHLPQSPPAYGLHLLGLAWLCTLATNRGQSISDLYPLINEILSAPADTVSDLADSSSPNFPSALAPHNIFWDCETVDLPADFRALWHEALSLGVDLLQTSLDPGRSWSPEQFFQKLDTLQSETHRELFAVQSPGPISSMDEIHSPNQDQLIYRLLGDIAAKWHSKRQDAAEGALPASQAQSESPLSPESAQTAILPRRPSGSPADDSEATLILPENRQTRRGTTRAAPNNDIERGTRKAGTPAQSPSPPPAVATAPDEEEMLAETVVLHQRKPSARQEPHPGHGQPRADRLQPLQENHSAQSPKPAPETPADQLPKEDLPETVILRPTGDVRRSAGGSPNRPPSPWQTAGERNRSRTPHPQSGAEPSLKHENSPPPPSKDDDDDLLTETVILRPGKDKP